MEWMLKEAWPFQRSGDAHRCWRELLTTFFVVVKANEKGNFSKKCEKNEKFREEVKSTPFQDKCRKEMFRTTAARSLFRLRARPGLGWRTAATSSKVMDDRMQYKWFLLVAAFGTMVYVNVVGRIQDQDHASNLEKYKKNFTPEEWDDYISQIERKTMLLENNEECYLIPIPGNSKETQGIVNKLGGKENVFTLDLNDLVKYQLETPNAKYHFVLKDNFEAEAKSNKQGFKYIFTYKLRPGLFTQLVNDAIKVAKEENPTFGRFVVLNYPPTIKEAVKFEQNITTNDFVIKFNKNDDSDIIQYFDTVDKTILLDDLKQLSPLKIDASSVKKQLIKQPEQKQHVCLADIEPDSSSSAIHRAQFKLRQLNQPIRLFGESDDDIINRLSKLQN